MRTYYETSAISKTSKLAWVIDTDSVLDQRRIRGELENVINSP